MIISAALGLTKPSFLEYSSGISLYSKVEKIQKVVALVKKRPNSNNIFDKFLHLINQDWEYIPFSQNNPLPEYLEFKFHRNVLEVIRIKPFRKNDKEFKLRIISKYGLILKEIILK